MELRERESPDLHAVKNNTVGNTSAHMGKNSYDGHRISYYTCAVSKLKNLHGRLFDRITATRENVSADTGPQDTDKTSSSSYKGTTTTGLTNYIL